MALIVKRGKLPSTPHTEFYHRAGILSLEEIHGVYGFSGAFARKMHLRSYPTEQAAPPQKAGYDLVPKPAKDTLLQPYHIPTHKMPYEGDPVRGRKAIVFGPSTAVSICKPVKSSPENHFFRNGERHELYFVQEGEGVLKTEFGDIRFRPQVYLVIPKGTTYRIELSGPKAYFMVIESCYPIEFPAHYLNSQGQAKMTAPVVETEIEAPELQEPADLRGKFPVDVQHGNGLVTRLTLGHHPFDLVGWEGALYPFLFDVKNHHGIAREIHTAPPAHQTFQAGNAPFNGFSVCSFIPQMEGWHPKDIPAPYAHYNVDSDECMFFANANYAARKGVIEPGAFTFHPGSIPHSPQGKAALRSMQSRGKISQRLAVMMDTFFESLQITETGWKYRNPDYPLSWSESPKPSKEKKREKGWSSLSA